ncbi:MAG: hypothetical protein LBN43_04585 [Oscillospiraceae bacterium]|jgi:hypothetical protein|nr:hypothetical protein [Oscillospiraceae bacterium]
MKNTLKRPIAALAAFVILAAAMIIGTSSAASDIYFTSVGDKLLPLTQGEIPVNQSGVMYVPYTVFNSSTLGTSVYYSKSSQIVQIMNGTKELRFDLGALKTYDNNGRYFNSSLAIIKNGKPFVPVSFVSGYFGLRYSFITNTGIESIVRVSTADSIFASDGEFVAAAYTRMNTYLSDYLASLPSAQSPATPIPQTPSPSPSPTPNYSDIYVYLVFFGAERGADILDALGDLPTTFYLTADEIRVNDDFVRRLIGAGKLIGVIEPETEANAVSASDYLREVAVFSTSLALSEIPLTVTVSEASAVLADAERNSEVVLNLVSDDDTAEALGKFIYEVQQGRYSVTAGQGKP